MTKYSVKIEYTIRAICLGWSGWAKYCPFEDTSASNLQEVIDMIDAEEDLYLGKDPIWMIAIYIDEDAEAVAIKTPLGWQIKEQEVEDTDAFRVCTCGSGDVWSECLGVEGDDSYCG